MWLFYVWVSWGTNRVGFSVLAYTRRALQDSVKRFHTNLQPNLFFKCCVIYPTTPNRAVHLRMFLKVSGAYGLF